MLGKNRYDFQPKTYQYSIQHISCLTVGDTLLKLSDFPFAYSLLAILFFSVGTDITKDHYLFLVISGFVATSLAIIDPFGKYVKWGRKRVITNSSEKDEEIKNIAVYFSRHGVFHKIPVSSFATNPKFTRFVEWFEKQAEFEQKFKEDFGCW